MEINYTFRGSITGLIFSGVSYLSIYTFIIPILSMYPGALIEGIASIFVKNTPYSNVGWMTIKLLLITLFTSLSVFLVWIFLKSRKSIKVTSSQIFKFMFFEYFVIHDLGFFYRWANDLNFRGDGQLVFGAVESFQISSWGFIPIGILIDIVKNLAYKK